jgi:hypothetical protein
MDSITLLPERLLATADVVLGSLLHLVNVVAGLFHVLPAECADHELGLHLNAHVRANVKGRSWCCVTRALRFRSKRSLRPAELHSKPPATKD